MENLDIKNLWKQNEALLEANRNLNTSLIREIKLEKVKSSLKSLLFLPISTLIFYGLLSSYAMYFMVIYKNIWYFVFSGAVVCFFSILLIISSIKQLDKILSIDYNNSILILQKDISKIKVAIIKNLRIAAWLLPFGPFIGLFFIKAFFDIDLMNLIDYNMLVSFGISTVILEIASLFLLNALKPKNMNKKWMNWLLKGSGSQVDEAYTFLEDIKKFKTES